MLRIATCGACRATGCSILAFAVCALLELGAAGGETPPTKPATVAEAVKVLDLTDFPLPKEVKSVRNRSVAGLFYEAPGNVKTIFQFQREQLLERNWKELPGNPETDQLASAAFARDGFTVSVMVFPSGAEGAVSVTLANHGNVAVGALPAPSGAKLFYDTPLAAAYMVDASLDETVAACRKRLVAQGWQPYGNAGNSWFFKQNAVRVLAQVASAPAQFGRSVITYSAEQLSADLPAPDSALNLQYADVTRQLSFDTASSQDRVATFYRTTLSKAGWRPTTEKPAQIDWKHVLIFRNPAGEMLTLEMYPVDDKLRVALKQQSAAEVAALEREAKAEAERKKQERDKPLPKLAIALPADAGNIKQDKGRIEFTVAAGKARAVVEGWQKQFGQSGWKENAATFTGSIGALSLSKDGQQLSITYLDRGGAPARITVLASGAELQQQSADQK